MRLDGKVAIVTGAGSGFGEGMAKRFAREGARVIVADVNSRGARRVADEIGEAAIPVTSDVSLRSEVDEMVYAAVNAFGRVDILVNNAGFTHCIGDPLKVDEKTFDVITDVNMKAVYHAVVAVAPIMERQGGGAILTTAAMSAIRPRPGLAWFNASKAWAIAATKSLALDLASRNIRVNCICPSGGETGMLAHFMGADTPALREKFRASVPHGRLSTPEEIATVALWLVSDEAAFVTGVAFEIEGDPCVNSDV